MAGHAFLKLSGLDGESTDSEHSGWIELTNFTFTLTKKEYSSDGESQKSKKDATISDVTVSKIVDDASPKLATASCTKQTFFSAKVELCRSGSTSGLSTYMTYEMENAFIKSYNVTGGSAYGVETITFGLGAMKWKHEGGGQGEFVNVKE